jgi:5-methylcytosine-specific restriction endonuclease McrA
MNRDRSTKKTVSLPNILEFCGHGTGLGKSLLATTAETLYRHHGYDVAMIRIESRQILHRGEHIAIPTENFARAATLVGGVSAVVEPVFAAVKSLKAGERRAVIIDWAGGHANHRSEIYAATRFGQRILARGLTTLSTVVTTNTSADMVHAASLLETSRQILPEAGLRLALNRRRGSFNFLSGSEQARAIALCHATGVPSFEIRAVGGECWKICDESGLTMSEVIRMDVDQLAERLRSDDFIAAAIQTEVAAWYSASLSELEKTLATDTPNG